MEETLRVLVAFAFALLFVILRSDAPRFGVADHLEPLRRVSRAVGRRRLAWYGLAVVLTAAITLAHPRPRAELGLTAGDLGPAIAFGLLGALLGTAAVAGTLVLRTWWRGRTPGAAAPVGLAGADLAAGLAVGLADPRALLARVAERNGSPRWLALDVVVIAIADELAFRGALLGFLRAAGVAAPIALLGQLLVYALLTRTAGPDGDRGRLALALGLGLLCGLVTLASGGVAAAVIAHLVTRTAFILGPAAERLAPRRAAAAG